ncbi:MAG TPA: MerR family transcriptional regulator [Candidatus Nitrosopolaris sp.]|nr:MerR family transcriptional regulator [Candidatus Nitrosopolaris sp.]
MSDTKLLISQLAAQVGMAPSALRYYEEAGLLTPTERSAAGYRLYGPEALGRVRFIQRAGALGLKLAEIRGLIESSHANSEAEQSALRAVLARKIDETRAKMAELNSRTANLLLVEQMLEMQPPPSCCHLGDCTCWFPDVA